MSDLQKHINKYGDKYKVYLKDKTIIITFIDKQLEEIFKEYNVKYEKVSDENENEIYIKNLS